MSEMENPFLEKAIKPEVIKHVGSFRPNWRTLDFMPHTMVYFNQQVEKTITFHRPFAGKLHYSAQLN